MYPRSGLGGKIFVLGSIQFNRESIDSRFLRNIFTRPRLINPQLMFTNSFLPLNTKNHILFKVMLKEKIELVIYKGKLAGLVYKTTKISLPKIKSSTQKLLPMTQTGINPYMDQ